MLGPVPSLLPVQSPPGDATNEVELGGYLVTRDVGDDEPLSCVRHPKVGPQEIVVRLIQDDDGYPGSNLPPT
ncbi:MAG: hypothetical protein FWE61_06805 [Micrococcales bacterium]|nr:hypothetical protein [Micrococcales bacterium]